LRSGQEVTSGLHGCALGVDRGGEADLHNPGLANPALVEPKLEELCGSETESAEGPDVHACGVSITSCRGGEHSILPA
jgi:hypothetical protein